MRTCLSVFLLCSPLILLPACGAPQDATATGEARPTLKAAADPPEIQLDPSNLFFGSVCAGSSDTLGMSIDNTGGSDLTISDLILKAPHFRLIAPPQLPATVHPGGSLRIRVRFSPPADSTLPYTGTLQVISDADNGNPTAHLTGLALPATLDLTPGELDFGDLYTGDSRTMNVKVTNNSSCKATVVGAPVYGTLSDLVSVDNIPGAMKPGDSQTMQVTLECDYAGDLTASLEVDGTNGLALGSTQLIGSCNDPGMSRRDAAHR